ncbi:CehA/McbA family metallohydrolase [Rhodococcus sp. NPDC056516]|uniref:CehA/McbA family metallohydrolase n=1 Tax=Rhodococcus sp. NPDC056516 TaxID=3345847 RepID=UPI0036701634
MEVAERDRPAGRWFRGDCHVHSVYSDGALTPPELAAVARSLGLDFLATTDHNTTAAHEAWRHEGIARELVIILGEEVTTGDGHWLALGVPSGQLVDWRYTADDTIAAQLDVVHEVGGICVVAHPYAPYPSGTFMYPYDGFDAIEVWNGAWDSNLPWQANNEKALAHWASRLVIDVPAGCWMPAIGNSDTHLSGQMGVPHNVVAADRLCADELVTSIKAGRSWISSAPTIELSLTATADNQCVQIGGELTTNGEPAMVRAAITGIPFRTITIHTESGPIHTESLSNTGIGELSRLLPVASTFVRMEARARSGHMAALSNPIILRG